MKKLIFILTAMFMTVAMSAQTQQNYVGSSRFFDNWSIGTDGGVSTNLHDWDTPNGGVWGIQLTKQVTPVIGFEFAGQLGFNDNANWNMPHSSNAVDNVTVMGSTKVNLMNLFCGYNGAPRLFEIQARGGIGYMRSFYPDVEGLSHGRTDVNRAVAKLGVDFDFNVGKQRAWTLSLRPAVVLKGQNGDAWCDNLDCSRYSHNAVGQLTAGVTYHFKTSNGRHYATNARLYDQAEIDRLNARIADLEGRQPKVVEKIVERHHKDMRPDATYAVTFAQNSAELTDDAKAILDRVPKNATVDVTGSTSPEGSVKRNTELAEQRAQAVADYLKSRGVNVNSAVGGEAGRAAIVTLKK